MPIMEHTILLQHPDENGNLNIGFPITQLGLIEDSANIKDAPGVNDYIPIIDGDGQGEMKKIPASELIAGSSAALYSETTAYTTGDYCSRDGKLYRCTVDMSKGEPWNPDHWVETSIPQELKTAQDAANKALEEAGKYANIILVAPSQNGVLTYTGESQSPIWDYYDAEKLAIGGTTSGTDAGTYSAIFTPKEGYKWADGTTDAKAVTWKISRANVDFPTQDGSLIYSGKAQSPTWNGYNAAKLTIGGVTSGTDAGNYTAAFTPTANYQWPDGSTAARSVSWSIQRAAIATVPSQNGSLVYTGSAQTVAWNDYDTAKLTIGGATSNTNAGTYSATFTPTSNYQWTDGSTSAKTVWSIQRVTIATVPSQSGSLTYTGSAQSPKWSNYDAAKLTIGSTTSGTNAGTYSATFTPTANYQWTDGSTAAKTVNWADGSTAAKTINWAIAKASLSVPAQSGSLTYTGSSQSPSWSNYDSAKLTIGGTTSGTNADSYSATFTPKANYQWSGGSTAAKTVTWTIVKASLSVPAQSGSFRACLVFTKEE